MLKKQERRELMPSLQQARLSLIQLAVALQGYREFSPLFQTKEILHSLKIGEGPRTTRDLTDFAPLIEAGVIYAQNPSFEGRKAMVAFLEAEEDIAGGAYYFSSAIAVHAEALAEAIERVQETGKWEAYLKLFLQCVYEAAEEMKANLEEIKLLYQRMEMKPELRRFLFQRPIFANKVLAEELGVSDTTARRYAKQLMDEGILEEETSERAKVFCFVELLKILDPDFEVEA